MFNEDELTALYQATEDYHESFDVNEDNVEIWIPQEYTTEIFTIYKDGDEYEVCIRSIEKSQIFEEMAESEFYDDFDDVLRQITENL